MKKKAISGDDLASLYTKLVKTNPKAILKGASIPYTSLNGHMYSYLSKDGFVALRLPAEAREKFIEKYKTNLVTAYGIVQKEYVVVPDTLLQDTNELKSFFDASFKYVSSMKPKPLKSTK